MVKLTLFILILLFALITVTAHAVSKQDVIPIKNDPTDHSKSEFRNKTRTAANIRYGISYGIQ
jgi:hypothetical protein